jgi:hypothetical protein
MLEAVRGTQRLSARAGVAVRAFDDRWRSNVLHVHAERQ